MAIFSFAQKKNFTFIAVAAKSDLSPLMEKGQLILEIRRRMEDALRVRPPARPFNLNFERTIVVCPWEWNSPLELGGNALGGETWDEICAYVARRYGRIVYDPSKNRAIHFLSPDREFAIFQFTAQIKKY